MSRPEFEPEGAGRGSAVAAAIQDLAMAGHATVTACVSPYLIDKILRAAAGPPSYEHIRRLWDGLPAHICERSAGCALFSDVTFAERPGMTEWHRQRDDTVASRAPRDFVPGFDLLVPLERDLFVGVLPGSGRLYLDQHADVAAARSVQVAPGDLMILDSRLLRRFESSGRRLMFSVVRDWITPRQVRAEAANPRVPPRAAAFFGRGILPCTDLREYLLRSRP